MGAFDWIGELIKAAASWVARCIPKFDPAVWNTPSVQPFNNCYNYACDLRTNTFAQPGRASGAQWTALVCGNVGAASVHDGLASSTSDDCGCSECCHTVALVMWPGEDYHWFRKGPDGKWSHKPGGTPATNLDNSGNQITDPRTANRGPYTVFCGFFCVNKGSVTIA
jgi:hypothetical protein